MAKKSFTHTLALLQGGAFIAVLTDLMSDTVKAVEDTGKSGKLTITLDIKKTGAAIQVHAKATNKVPEPAADPDLLWATVEGNLVQQNPAQMRLDIRETGEPTRRVDVDSETGEIRKIAGE